LPTKEIVAIKLMKNCCADIYSARKELSELNILRKCTQHDNTAATKIHDIIIAPHDRKSQDPIPYIFIVMEHICSDLSEVLKNIESLEVDKEQTLIMMYNMLLAMNYMHTSNIVHRDIKPSNILIHDDCQLRICDFGLSRSLPKSELLDSVKNLEMK